MRRFLCNLLTLLSLLLCVLSVVLWVRSRNGIDTVMVRTAPSYARGPGVKWVAVRTHDGWVVSLYRKVVPEVDGGSPPWRDDVPLGYKRLVPPGSRAYQKITDADRVTFEADAGERYGSTPVFRWWSHQGTTPRGGPPRLITMTTLWTQLGFHEFAPNAYHIHEGDFPGAYREESFNIPHSVVVAVSAVPPLLWAGLWVRRFLARKRVGHCPACGYDLRGSPLRCPECGRDVTDDEVRAAAFVGEGEGAAGVRRAGRRRTVARVFRRPELVLFAGIVIGLVLLVRSGSEKPSAGPRISLGAASVRGLLEARLADVAREVERLRAAGDAAGAAALEAELRRYQDAAAGGALEPGDTPEVHVVGVYQGAPPRRTTRSRRGHPVGAAAVDVRATGRPIVLVLCAYEPVKWDVRVATGARLEKVILGGYYDQQVPGVPDGVPVQKNVFMQGAARYFFAYDSDHEEYASMARALRKLTGLGVTTFQGQFAYGGQPFVVGPGNLGWEAQRVLADMEPLHQKATAFERRRAAEAVASLRFEGVWAVPRGKAFFIDSSLATFSPSGPVAGTIRTMPHQISQVAFDPVAGKHYGSDGHRLITFEAGSRREEWVADGGNLRVPPFYGGIAFDTRRRRLMVAGRTGPGPALYTYAPDSKTWAAAGTPGRDVELLALTYSGEGDCFYALANSRDREGPAVLVRISPAGVGEWRVPLPTLNLGRRRGALAPMPQLIAVGPLVAVVTPSWRDPRNPELADAPRCVLIDPVANEVVYEGELAEQGVDGGGTPSVP